MKTDTGFLMFFVLYQNAYKNEMRFSMSLFHTAGNSAKDPASSHSGAGRDTVSDSSALLFSPSDLRALIVPLIFEQALAMTVGMADTVMISAVGEAAVSGVSLVDMINNLVFAIFSALATGGAVVTSQYLGARRPKQARDSAAQLLLTVLVLGLAVMLLTIWVKEPLLRLFFGGIEDDVMQNALIYFLISALSFPFLAVYNACAALFRSMGNAAITLKTAVVVNLINIIGNYVGVFLLHLGTAGVAIPSLLSRAAGALILYVLLRSPRQEICLTHFFVRPDWSVIRKILYIGIPSGTENGIFQLGRILVVSIIALFGTAQIAANGVANSLDSIGVIIGQATSLAMITVIGQCVGAGSETQIRYYLKKILLITYVPSVVLDLALIAFLNPILSVFSLSPEATDLTWKLVVIHTGFAMLLWPLAFVFPNMLRACNDVRYTMIVSIASMFTFRIVLSYILGVNFGMGAVGVWLAMVVDWICRIICFLLRYRSGKWKKLAGLPQ